MTYATFGQRVLAQIIDLLWMVPMALILQVLLYGNAAFDPDLHARYGAELVSWTVPAVIIIDLWIRYQATPGKIVMRIRIVDAATGGAPTVWQYVSRYAGYLISGLILGVGYLWVLFDERRQAWHDKIAGTVVVLAD